MHVCVPVGMWVYVQEVYGRVYMAEGYVSVMPRTCTETWKRGCEGCVCGVFADVWREEVLCMHTGRGNIGLCFHGESEGHMCTCGCPSGCGSGVCRGMWVCACICGRHIYAHSRYTHVGFVCSVGVGGVGL